MTKNILKAALCLGLLAFGLSLAPIDQDFLRHKNIQTNWLSLLPAALVVTLAIATRRIIPALLAGVVLAAGLAAGPNPLDIFERLFAVYFAEIVTSPFNWAILTFTTALIGLVAVASRSGGTGAVVALLLRYAKGLRGTRVVTVLMGLAVFFDDYANMAIVGPTLKPVFDRMGLSREKLAYLIDSTAAPIAGLAIISTWVGAEVGYLQSAAAGVGIEVSGYSLFLQALPYRFYCIFALALVFFVAWSGRDFKAMRLSEEKARQSITTPKDNDVKRQEWPATKVRFAFVPLVFVLVTIVGSIYFFGAAKGSGVLGLFQFVVWQEAFTTMGTLAHGNALSYVFALSAVLGSLLAIALPWQSGSMHFRDGFKAWFDGVKAIPPALAILVLAWALAHGAGELHTATYLVALLKGKLPELWLPLLIFFTAAAVAFSTGTSWGTMALLIPSAVELAYQMGGEAAMLVAMAAVLDGAIFGDHCSPISDTTILSSICSGSDHIAHVRTQLPYALLGFVAAAGAGYGLGVVAGFPLWSVYVLGMLLMVAALMVLAKEATL
ncbi:MAG: Na+/H+ antiporter NhaC family protein [Myxococcota bacterium]|jgi:Na+/H+ antiporter NhaC|nr:Na+/H+ antiporter NhaC family protein [Myxococcota bacterium]